MVHRGALLAVLLAGCGATEEPLPVACRADADTYGRALRDAPAVVRVDATTTLAECVRRSAGDADLVSTGAALTTLAERLELRAAGGDRTAALQLGYLVGAVQRAARDTEGIHAELAYRIERSGAAAADAAPSVEQALWRGIRAGEERG